MTKSMFLINIRLLVWFRLSPKSKLFIILVTKCFFLLNYMMNFVSGIIGIHSAMKYVGITTDINYALLFDVSEKDF